MARHPKVHHAPRTKLNEEEDKHLAEEQIYHQQEIAGPNVLGVILQESRAGGAWPWPRSDLTNVFLNRGFGDREAQLEKFPLDPFGMPQLIVLGHLLDQSDRVRGECAASAPMARLELPEEAKSLAMPAQERVRLEDEGGVFPMLDAAGQQDQPQTIRSGKGWLLDLSMEDEELLAEHGVLCDEFGFAAGEVDCR